MEQPADQELVIKAQAGDSQSFAALVDRHYLTAYRFAYKWCRCREDAEEDINQEVFVKLAGKLHFFDRRCLFTTWRYGITAIAPGIMRDQFGYRSEFLNLVRLAKTGKAMYLAASASAWPGSRLTIPGNAAADGPCAGSPFRLRVTTS